MPLSLEMQDHLIKQVETSGTPAGWNENLNPHWYI